MYAGPAARRRLCRPGNRCAGRMGSGRRRTPPRTRRLLRPRLQPTPARPARRNGSISARFGPLAVEGGSAGAQHVSAPSATADLIARLHAGLSEPASSPELAPPPPMQFAVPLGASAPSPRRRPYGRESTPAAPYVELAPTQRTSTTTGTADYSSAPAAPSNFVPPFPTARPADPWVRRLQALRRLIPTRDRRQPTR